MPLNNESKESLAQWTLTHPVKSLDIYVGPTRFRYNTDYLQKLRDQSVYGSETEQQESIRDIIYELRDGRFVTVRVVYDSNLHSQAEE